MPLTYYYKGLCTPEHICGGNLFFFSTSLFMIVVFFQQTERERERYTENCNALVEIPPLFSTSFYPRKKGKVFPFFIYL